MTKISGAAAIVGVARTPGYSTPGRYSLELHAALCLEALADAGLRKEQVDAILTAGCDFPTYTEEVAHSAVLSEHLGISPQYTYTVDIGTPAFVKMVEIAATAIATGLCHTVLIACAEPTVSSASRRAAVDKMADFGQPDFELPFGPTIPAFYALIASRFMHEYGTTPEQLARVAVAMRRHAAANADARFRDPLTTNDVLRSRPIAEPLRLLDCCLTTEGGAAVVVTARERAGDTPHHPVVLLGAGQAFSHEHLVAAPSLTSFAEGSAARAFGMAGITPSDVDVAFLYDNFTISVISQLEDLGFCGRGEGGQFVESGTIDPGGRLPVNPNGGLLSEGHPGRAGGFFHLVEAVRQLRHDSRCLQIDDAEIAVVHSVGGIMSNHATAILARS